jgi:hypothetical protein
MLLYQYMVLNLVFIKEFPISSSLVVEVCLVLPVEYRVVLIGLFSGVACRYGGKG